MRSYLLRAIAPTSVAVTITLAGCMTGQTGEEGTQAHGELAALGIEVGPACQTDADCRVAADYCSDCTCVPLGAQQTLPECLGEKLTCVLNPCADHTAHCVEGRCSAEAGEFR